MNVDVSVLTPAELSICQEYAASDLQLKQIAQARFVSVNTAKSQIRASFRKLGVGSRAELRRVLAERTTEAGE